MLELRGHMTETIPVLLREANALDAPFIMNSWLWGFRSSAFASAVSNSEYFPGHQALILEILARSQALIAYNPEDPTQYYGWVCFETLTELPVVHFVSVKQAFRGFGIARKLLTQATGGKAFFYTHDTTRIRAPRDRERETYKFNQVIKKLKEGGTYNPYLAFIGGK